MVSVRDSPTEKRMVGSDGHDCFQDTIALRSVVCGFVECALFLILTMCRIAGLVYPQVRTIFDSLYTLG